MVSGARQGSSEEPTLSPSAASFCCQLVNSAASIAVEVDTLLGAGARREGGRGETHLLVTDASERLRRVAGRFLGREAAVLELVDLP